MDHTTYYNLSKPHIDEIVNVEDANANMDIIDETMHECSEALGELNSLIPLVGNLSQLADNTEALVSVASNATNLVSLASDYDAISQLVSNGDALNTLANNSDTLAELAENSDGILTVGRYSQPIDYLFSNEMAYEVLSDVVNSGEKIEQLLDIDSERLQMILNCAYETVALADQKERLIEYAESDLHYLIDYVDEFLQLGYCLANDYLDLFNETFYLREHELKMYHETYVLSDRGDVTINGTTDDGQFIFGVGRNGVEFHGQVPHLDLYDDETNFMTTLTAGEHGELHVSGLGGDISLTGYDVGITIIGSENKMFIDSADVSLSGPYLWPGGYDSLRRLLEALVSATGVSLD